MINQWIWIQSYQQRRLYRNSGSESRDVDWMFLQRRGIAFLLRCLLYSLHLSQPLEAGSFRLQKNNDSGQQIRRFIEDVHLVKRIHSAFGCMTPAQFYVAWR